MAIEKSIQWGTVLDGYIDYLERQRGLTERTLKTHREYVATFLKNAGQSSVESDRPMSSAYVIAFFRQQSEGRKMSMRRLLQGVLRSFLRFCFQKGYSDRDLAAAIPCISSYKLSGVPRGIAEQDVVKVLECIDRATPVGHRDFAIIQMLHCYGVRGGQIRALQLADVDWRKNRIRFPSSKGGKELVQPLTKKVGESLLDYLRYGRPEASYPEVFLTAQPPIRPLRSPCAVSQMIHLRLNRAGVNTAHKGSHIFRHAFAARMLQRGQSLKTIADLLGHRNINTTFIYTKVDLNTLRQASLEWPEV